MAIFAGVLPAALGGCGVLRAQAHDRAELEGYYRGSAAEPGRLYPAELHALVTAVAHNRITQENQISGKRVRGVYVLPQEACAIVAVENLDDMRLDDRRMTKPGETTGVHVQQYRVCGDKASRIDGNDLPPGYPDTGNARATLNQARRAALLYGAQTVTFEGYRIDTRRLGVDSAKACRPVETAISHNGLLVQHDLVEVCQ